MTVFRVRVSILVVNDFGLNYRHSNKMCVHNIVGQLVWFSSRQRTYDTFNSTLAQFVAVPCLIFVFFFLFVLQISILLQSLFILFISPTLDFLIARMNSTLTKCIIIVIIVSSDRKERKSNFETYSICLVDRLLCVCVCLILSAQKRWGKMTTQQN